MDYKAESIMAFGDSEITHLYADGLVRHVIYRTLVLNNVKIAPSYIDDGFVWLETNQKNIGHNEYDGYFSGKKYIHKYIKFLD